MTLIAGSNSLHGQATRLFRISGPAATTILSLNQDGALVWSNSLSGTNYIIQTATPPNWTNWADYVQLPVVNSGTSTNKIIDFNPPTGMTLIPAGSFTMGDTLDGESDAVPTSVYVSDIYIETNLVSYAQWQTMYNWATNHGYVFNNAGSGKTPNDPVQTVNWYDCLIWCNARSQQAGLMPVYYTDAGFTQLYARRSTQFDQVFYANWTNNGYRLPTEAEWEKAARGGLSGHRFPWGDTISENQANYNGCTSCFSYDLGPDGFNPGITNGFPLTSPVGCFAPNGYGLYDMSGNLCEWCWDWYATQYSGGTDPRGPDTGMYERVVRSGFWSQKANFSRCAQRGYVDPGVANIAFGFRCVRPH